MKTVDRELSWVNFNHRVLHQATRKSVPLLERMKFLGISFSNLDEFVSVRFSDLLERFLQNSQIPDDLGIIDYSKKYNTTMKFIKSFKVKQYDVFDLLIKELKQKLKVDLLYSYKELSNKEKESMKEYFNDNIFPLLTPIAYETTKENPYILNKEMNFLVKVVDSQVDVLCLLTVPNSIERFIKISDKKYILVEEIIKMCLQKLFRNKEIKDYIVFKSNKFFNENVKHDSDRYLIDRMRDVLRMREYGNNHVFLDIQSSDKESQLVKVLYKLLDVYKEHIYLTKKPICLDVLINKFHRDPQQEYDDFTPQYPADLLGAYNIFEYLNKDDLLVQHPYESFDIVVNFINEAAMDKNVVSIKQTLYRVSSEDSSIIEALCKASRNGKRVTVMLELLARFDEEQNMRLTEKLKNSGCNVIYGLENYKTHCKICIVAKKTKKGIKLYSHIGTGNYNDKTSNIYTDISYMTSNSKIGDDLNNIFNMLSGFSMPKNMETISFSPINIRSKLFDLIDREIKNVKKGRKGYVILKMNSLCDLRIIKKIYEAADKGVKFDIICRGICSIVNTKNISIKSIVGRFLEHSRVYYFYNNSDEEIYISSADLLTRNLDKRIEIMIPIKVQKCIDKLKNILTIMKKDEYNSYVFNKDYYEKVKGKINAHQLFIELSVNHYTLPKKKKKE